jgi:hypothetical protein
MRTRARSAGEAGSSGGSGQHSSMLADDRGIEDAHVADLQRRHLARGAALVKSPM